MRRVVWSLCDEKARLHKSRNTTPPPVVGGAGTAAVYVNLGQWGSCRKLQANTTLCADAELWTIGKYDADNAQQLRGVANGTQLRPFSKEIPRPLTRRPRSLCEPRKRRKF